MSAGDLSGLLDSPGATDEAMAVDLSFLDGYRRPHGSGEESSIPVDPGAPAERGGSGGEPSATEPTATISADDRSTPTVVPQGDGPGPSDPPAGPPPRGEAVGADSPARSVSLALTDHQDAVQSAASERSGTGGGTDGTGAPLPQSGFRLGGVQGQPHIRSLPDSIVGVLREELRAAAVRELGASDQEAREFCRKLSQASLVSAFLIAQLDLRMEADDATTRAVELFRTRDPLLGSVAARIERMERSELERAVALDRISVRLGEVQRTASVVEQALAYSIADRTENFLRGSHDIHDAPITHRDAVFVRDRARAATEKLTREERERDGRPIR